VALSLCTGALFAAVGFKFLCHLFAAIFDSFVMLLFSQGSLMG